MKLRGKIILTVSLTVAGLLLMNLTGVQTVLWHSLRQTLHEMQDGFTKIEDYQLEQNLRRVQDAYMAELLNAENRLSDWAQWDDAWQFMHSKDPEFIASNLSADVLQSMQYDFMIFIDNQKKTVAFQSTELDSNLNQRLLQEIDSLILKSSVLDSFTEYEKVRSGFFELNYEPVVFAARPILQTSGLGPVRGTLIFAKYLNTIRVQEIAERIHLEITLERLPKNYQDTVSYPVVDRTDEQHIHAKLLVRDYFSKPSYEFNVAIPRTIRKQAQETEVNIVEISKQMGVFYIISAIFSGFVMIGLLVFMINRFLLAKVRILESHMDIIRRESTYDLRVPELGADEIGGFAKQFNAMLDSLQIVKNILNKQSLERKALLDALPTPLLVLDAKFRVAGELSHKAIEVFGSHIANKSWASVLDLSTHETEELEDYLDVHAKNLMSLNDLKGLNPIREIQLSTGAKPWLKIEYFSLPHSENPLDNEWVLLVIVEDVTKEKEHQNEMKSLHADNAWLKAILVDPDLFVEFFRESRQGLDVASFVLTGRIDEPEVANAFRHVHTLQGCASGFGLTALSEAAVKLEDQLTRILQALRVGNQSERLSAEVLAHEALDKLMTVLTKEQNRLLGALNAQASDWKAGPSIRIALHKLNEWSVLLASGEIEEARAGIQNQLRVPLSRILNRTIQWFPGMVSRSSKQAELRLIGGEIPIPVEWSTSLNDILVHILRNAMAHGVEYPEERTLRGKSEIGNIRIWGRLEDENLILEIEDDGGGFQIQVDKAFGLGNSSRSSSDGLAGRGVGLHAVRTMVEELGGTIDVRSTPGKGATFILRFNLNPVF